MAREAAWCTRYDDDDGDDGNDDDDSGSDMYGKIVWGKEDHNWYL